jgi:NAD(P)-dependent dehydrogenase (short-subunit alcohol dehydrogenase family)
MKILDGKIAIVTGAGGGVGQAYALGLANQGAKIVVNDLGVSVDGGGQGTRAADLVVEQIIGSGGSAIANYDDISDFAGAARLTKTAIDHFGRIDILVANAGIIRPTKLYEAKEDDWSKVLAVHANGTFNCYRHCAPTMMQQRSGTIITTGADIGRYHSSRDAFPGIASYRAAKAAILVLTFAAADELRSYDINVNSIMPGATTTRMQARYFDSLTASGIATREDLENKWPKPVPPETVPPLGIFLCTEMGRRITGRAFTINGSRITMTTGAPAIASLETEAESWTLEAVSKTLPKWATV